MNRWDRDRWSPGYRRGERDRYEERADLDEPRYWMDERERGLRSEDWDRAWNRDYGTAYGGHTYGGNAHGTSTYAGTDPYGRDEPPFWAHDERGGHGYGRGGFGRSIEKMDRALDRFADKVGRAVNRTWDKLSGGRRYPKNYKRSDERIREDVCECLSEQSYLDPSDIEVRVQNGEVTLAGTVMDRQQKRLAEDLVADLPGVEDVHNQLRIARRDLGNQPGGGATVEQKLGGSSAGYAGTGTGMPPYGRA